MQVPQMRRHAAAPSTRKRYVGAKRFRIVRDAFIVQHLPNGSDKLLQNSLFFQPCPQNAAAECTRMRKLKPECDRLNLSNPSSYPLCRRGINVANEGEREVHVFRTNGTPLESALRAHVIEELQEAGAPLFRKTQGNESPHSLSIIYAAAPARCSSEK